MLAVEAWLASRSTCEKLYGQCARQLAIGLLPRALDRLGLFRHVDRAVRFVTRPLDERKLSKAELMGLAPAELIRLCKLKGVELGGCSTHAGAADRYQRAQTGAVEGDGHACQSAGPAVHACNRARLGFCCAAPEAWVGAELGVPLGAPADELVQLVRSVGRPGP